MVNWFGIVNQPNLENFSFVFAPPMALVAVKLVGVRGSSVCLGVFVFVWLVFDQKDSQYIYIYIGW